ncbi:MAG: type II toxin-antitoxin system HicA family toxin [Bacillota bacterium]
MKRRDMIKLLKKNGWWLKRHGGNHDIYTNGKEMEAVSHTPELNEHVCKSIIKRRGLI